MARSVCFFFAGGALGEGDGSGAGESAGAGAGVPDGTGIARRVSGARDASGIVVPPTFAHAVSAAVAQSAKNQPSRFIRIPLRGDAGERPLPRYP
jgi:hypothetical protein